MPTHKAVHVASANQPLTLVDVETPSPPRDHVRIAVAACGVCDGCLAGHEQLCRELLARIYGLALDVGMAEEILVAPRCLIDLPDTIDPEDASVIEPLAIAVHGFNRVGVTVGERVLVVGGGAIGLSALSVTTTIVRPVAESACLAHRIVTFRRPTST